MRPVKLIMKNIGPYRDEVIDFTELENMFLITGDTGAGKTFIFDAMTFALYGGLRGNRVGHESQLKSRYADEKDESFVEFTFETGEKKYRIRRTVPFVYTKKTGTVGKKNSEVDLVQLENGIEIKLGNQIDDVNKKIKNIIGLDIDEFSKIVLLPQGAFAEFLKQNSSKRAEMLKKIFPVESYSQMMASVKEKVKVAQLELEKINAIITNNETGFDFSNGEEKLNQLQAKLDELENIEKENQNNCTEIEKQIVTLNHEFEAAKKTENDKARLEELKSKKSDFKNLEEKIILAEKANSLSEVINLSLSTAQELKKASAEFENSTKEQSKIKKELEKLEEQKEEIALIKKVIEADKKNLSVLQEKADKAKRFPDIEKMEKQISQIEKNAIDCKEKIQAQYDEKKSKIKEKNIDEAINTLADEIKKLTEEKSRLQIMDQQAKERDENIKSKKSLEEKIESLTKKIEKENLKAEKLKKTIEDAEKELKEYELKNISFAISAELKPQKPCPVCGSLEHPCPAKKVSELLGTDEVLKTSKESLESVNELIDSLKTNLTQEKTTLKTTEKTLTKLLDLPETEVINNQLKEINENTKSKETNLLILRTAQKEIKQLDEKLKEAENEYNEIHSKYVEIMAEKKALLQLIGKNETYDSLIEKTEKLEEKIEGNVLSVEDFENSFNEFSNAKAAVEAKVNQCKKTKDESEKKQIQAEKNLAEKIAASEFKSADAAKKAMLEQDEISNYRKDLSDFEQNLKSAEDAVKNSKCKVSSIEIEAELNKKKDELSELKQVFQTNHEELDKIKEEKTNFKTSYDNVKKAYKAREKLEKEIEPLKRLESDLNGKNPQSIQFDTWALGMYFEQIVEFASIRFEDMSNGRFKFQLKDIGEKSGSGYKGLDILVLDTYNGTLSDPAELSGGETFEASISLALALTDVVQSNNGGIQLDSLFIDEGFGTLDPETMDKAMEVLTELGERKMVGIISHVESLQNQDFVKSLINVSKTKNGSTIEVKSL